MSGMDSRYNYLANFGNKKRSLEEILHDAPTRGCLECKRWFELTSQQERKEKNGGPKRKFCTSKCTNRYNHRINNRKNKDYRHKYLLRRYRITTLLRERNQPLYESLMAIAKKEQEDVEKDVVRNE